MKWIMWVPCILFLLLGILLAEKLFMTDNESQQIEKPVPRFNLSELTDSQKTFSQDNLLGQMTLVNFWASWCASCRQEHAALLEITQKYGLLILGINYKDNPLDATHWLQTWGNPYFSTLQDSTGEVGIEWGVIAIPESYLVDTQGIVRYKHTGPLTLAIWEKEIWPLACKGSANAFPLCKQTAFAPAQELS